MFYDIIYTKEVPLKFIYCRHKKRNWDQIKAQIDNIRSEHAGSIVVTEDPRIAIQEAQTRERVVLVTGIYHYKYRGGVDMEGLELATIIKRKDPLAIVIMLTSVPGQLDQLRQ